jgi:ketosteroid isomerase-like protein
MPLSGTPTATAARGLAYDKPVTQDESIDLVRRAFSAALAGDWPTFRDLAKDDFTWTMPGTSRVAGVVTGTDAFAAKFAVVGEANVEAEMLDVLGSGTRVVTVQRNRAQGNPGLDITALNLFTLVEGKIASMQTFPLDLYALDRFWGPPR